MTKNLCAKTVKCETPYEVWATADGSWEWRVLKKWQVDDNKLGARWFCCVHSPITREQMVHGGEMGDVYVHEIKAHASKVTA